MKSDVENLKHLISGMREAFFRGENAMAWARANSKHKQNSVLGTLVAYDLQAGSYVKGTQNNLDYHRRWTAQLASFVTPYLESGDSILEVGVGEATTLTGVLANTKKEISAFGLDVSWSRIKVACEWAADQKQSPRLFVGDLFHVPLADNAVDVVYTSHSLEPNGGNEEPAVAELLRVARKAVVLVEPIYELASAAAQERMEKHGYVRNLKTTAEKLSANVVQYGLLDICGNQLNPSGVVLLEKQQLDESKSELGGEKVRWQCPLTGAALEDLGDVFYGEEVGIAYPVLRGVPLLRPEHAVVASRIDAGE